jgi:hypothetical protein
LNLVLVEVPRHAASRLPLHDLDLAVFVPA